VREVELWSARDSFPFVHSSSRQTSDELSETLAVISRQDWRSSHLIASNIRAYTLFEYPYYTFRVCFMNINLKSSRTYNQFSKAIIS
jgi:hypothetical protein